MFCYIGQVLIVIISLAVVSHWIGQFCFLKNLYIYYKDAGDTLKPSIYDNRVGEILWIFYPMKPVFSVWVLVTCAVASNVLSYRNMALTSCISFLSRIRALLCQSSNVWKQLLHIFSLTYISVYAGRGIIQYLLYHQGWSQEHLPLLFELLVSLHLFANLLIQS